MALSPAAAAAAASLGFHPLFPSKSSSTLPPLRLHTPLRNRYLNLTLNLNSHLYPKPSLLYVSASHQESASDVDINKDSEDFNVGAQESEEAWQQALASFKDQALKMQSQSKETYQLYSEKAIVILKETSEKLKIQAEKARQDLSVIAKEVAEESKEYLATAAENSPEPVKDIVETFAVSSDKFSDVSKLEDFYVGIPYGALLSAGGFLSFMLTGSIPAIRFGIVLGGTLLALGVSSLRSWKRGDSSPLALKGQAAISTILFLRQLRLLSMRPFIANIITTIFSGGVVAFYIYRIVRDRGNADGGHAEAEPQS